MTTTELNLSYIQQLSNYVGTSEAALRLLLSILIGYPLAAIYRKYIFSHTKLINHLFMIITGILICLFNYGFELYHSVIAIVVTYLLIVCLRGSALVISSFTFHMGYLLIGYYFTGTETYDIKWTMPHCVLVLRLIGLSFDVSDGQQSFDKLSTENKKSALVTPPNLMEIASYTYFPASFLVGPQFSFKRYDQFMNKNFEQFTGNVNAGIKRGLLGVLYLTMHQIGVMMLPDSYMETVEFTNCSFIYKLIFVGLWGKFTLYKYISCWLLSEGVATCFGLTFVGVTSDGKEDWSGCENIKLLQFENAGKLAVYVTAFNANTNQWVAQYIFKRLKFMGNRSVSHLTTLMFLAVWHGFHSGYYVCFLMEFLIVVLERELEPILRGNDKILNLIEMPILQPFIWLFLKFYTLISLGWSLVPFVFLSYSKWLPIYCTLYFYGAFIFMLWPIVYKPLLRLLLLKNKNKQTEKSLNVTDVVGDTNTKQHKIE